MPLAGNGSYATLADVPKFSRTHYKINVPWDYLEDWLARLQERPLALDLNPTFQRGHVWTVEQKSRYVEFVLRGGEAARQLQFNCRGWMKGMEGPFVLVDGKQRMEAARGFLRNEVTAFGKYRKDYPDAEKFLGIDCAFEVSVYNLNTMDEVYQLYIDLNTGGTVHTDAEIAKVRKMMTTSKGS